MAQQPKERAEMLQSRAQTYLQCKTAKERLSFTLTAIDDTVIDAQIKIGDLKTLFGEDFIDLGMVGTSGAKYAAYIGFEKGPRNPAPSDPRVLRPAAAAQGWYLYVEYDQGGLVRNYWLSNLHKGTPNRPERE